MCECGCRSSVFLNMSETTRQPIAVVHMVSESLVILVLIIMEADIGSVIVGIFTDYTGF